MAAAEMWLSRKHTRTDGEVCCLLARFAVQSMLPSTVMHELQGFVPV